MSSYAGLACHDVFIDNLKEGCPFCDAILNFQDGKKPSHFDRTVLSTSENGNFFVKSQRGGFLPGSVLIASNRHSLTRISDMTKDEFIEFFNFYEHIKLKVTDAFGEIDYISFENGTVGSDTVKAANERDAEDGGCRLSGGGCLSHFHWHFSPLQKPKIKNTLGFQLPNAAKPISGWSSFFEIMKANPKVIYTLIDYRGQLYFVNRQIYQRRSEWMRLLIASYLQDEGLIEGHYSWRKKPRFENAVETLKLFGIEKQ